MQTEATDYETYCEIMNELLAPIREDGLDRDTLKRLYESKLVYLENLRVKCFFEINSVKQPRFSPRDYELIYLALERTKDHLRDLIVVAVSESLRLRV